MVDPATATRTPSTQEPSELHIVRANFSVTALEAVGTFGRSVGLRIESVSGAVGDLLRLRFKWREALSQSWYFVGVTTIPAI